jgi:Cft2 family RNA processing exonuclease
MPWRVESSDGIHLPQIGWHLDAKRRVERSFVSHAHSDHIGRHKTVLCTAATARLMAARLSGKRSEILLPFETEHRLDDGTRVSLHPAGHILGSAQFLAENEHGSLLYTGDFKLEASAAAEPCGTPRADVLIMETTFGLPRYVFPPAHEVLAAIVQFCRAAIADRAVPVLFGYSLGKSQEILAGLASAELPVMIHSDVAKMTRIYEEFGVRFPEHRKFVLDEVAGHVVICPPQMNRSAWLEKIQPRRTAAVTGWAVDPGAIYRQQCDAVFPLSDHADFDGLLRFVELVQARLVYTVHGFAAEFARELRARGIEAWALGQENQLDLPLPRPAGADARTPRAREGNG